MRSLGPEQILNSFLTQNFDTLYELCSSGQSGSLFYYTKDKRYMIKTIPKREFSKFLSILQKYYEHLKENPETLISRFFGLHSVRWKDSKTKFQKRYLVIMNNVFKDFEVGVRYDLKGSTTGRNYLNPQQGLEYVEQNNIKTALKCNDFRRLMKQIILDEEGGKTRVTSGELKQQCATFKQVLTKDANFFAAAGIIDYSLLLGEVSDIDVQDLKEQIRQNPELGNGVYFDTEGRAWVIGIIDPLTGFNFKKGVEYNLKRLRHGHDMSCVPPEIYAQRFKDFMAISIQSNVDPVESDQFEFDKGTRN